MWSPQRAGGHNVPAISSVVHAALTEEMTSFVDRFFQKVLVGVDGEVTGVNASDNKSVKAFHDYRDEDYRPNWRFSVWNLFF